MTIQNPRICQLVFALFITFIGQNALAKISIEHSAQVEKMVVDADGNKTIEYLPTDPVIPGDIIVYNITATNTGPEAAENILITDAISEHVTYIIGSAASNAPGKNTSITFSIDNGKNFADAGELVVKKEGEEQVATAEDYTHIRWQLNFSLAPGKHATVSFKAKVK